MKRYLSCFILLIVFIVAISGTVVYAAPINMDNIKNYDFDKTNPPQTMNYSFLKSTYTFLIYLFFFILIAVLAFFTSRWLSKCNIKYRAKSKYMEIIDNLPLGSNGYIYIVKAPQGLLMIGVSEKGINVLERLGDRETELINEADEPCKDLSSKSFIKQLNEFIGNYKSGGNDV